MHLLLSNEHSQDEISQKDHLKISLILSETPKLEMVYQVQQKHAVIMRKELDSNLSLFDEDVHVLKILYSASKFYVSLLNFKLYEFIPLLIDIGGSERKRSHTIGGQNHR